MFVWFCGSGPVLGVGEAPDCSQVAFDRWMLQSCMGCACVFAVHALSRQCVWI
jgi:hypothetical protein